MSPAVRSSDYAVALVPVALGIATLGALGIRSRRRRIRREPRDDSEHDAPAVEGCRMHWRDDRRVRALDCAGGGHALIRSRWSGPAPPRVPAKPGDLWVASAR